MTDLVETEQQRLSALIEAQAHEAGALLPLLHRIQQEWGYIPPAAIPLLAQALQHSVAEIHGVISFYHQFRTRPAGQFRVQICRAEACQARGSRAIEQQAKQLLGLDYHETSADGLVSLDSVYCLGNCATGPNLRINERLIGRVDTKKLNHILTNLRENAA